VIGHWGVSWVNGKIRQNFQVNWHTSNKLGNPLGSSTIKKRIPGKGKAQYFYGGVKKRCPLGNVVPKKGVVMWGSLEKDETKWKGEPICPDMEQVRSEGSAVTTR